MVRIKTKKIQNKNQEKLKISLQLMYIIIIIIWRVRNMWHSIFPKASRNSFAI